MVASLVTTTLVGPMLEFSLKFVLHQGGTKPVMNSILKVVMQAIQFTTIQNTSKTIQIFNRWINRSTQRNYRGWDTLCSPATLSVVMCNTSQCKLRSLRVNSGVTVWVYRWFEFEIRSGYLLLANQHTSSEGQGSRDLCQTRVKPYWIEIVGHSTNFRSHFESSTVYKSTRHTVPISIICEHPNVKFVVRKRNVWKGVLNKVD